MTEMRLIRVLGPLSLSGQDVQVPGSRRTAHVFPLNMDYSCVLLTERDAKTMVGCDGRFLVPNFSDHGDQPVTDHACITFTLQVPASIVYLADNDAGPEIVSVSAHFGAPWTIGSNHYQGICWSMRLLSEAREGNRGYSVQRAAGGYLGAWCIFYTPLYGGDTLYCPPKLARELLGKAPFRDEAQLLWGLGGAPASKQRRAKAVRVPASFKLVTAAPRRKVNLED